MDEHKETSPINAGYTQASLLDPPLDARQSRRDSGIDDMRRDAILTGLLGMASVKGIGAKTLCSMFDTRLLHDIWDLTEPELLARWASLPATQTRGRPQDIARRRTELRAAGKEAARRLQSEGVTFCPLGHASYPERLWRLQEPPRWLFVRGNTAALHKPATVGVVGSREATPQALRLAYRCASELVSREVVVLSGLAKGIDEQAHLGAVDYWGQSIAVLGHGINGSLAASQRSLASAMIAMEGAIVSEYLPGIPANRARFLRRNELQAALARVVIAVQCPTMKSGTGATIRRAMRLQTPVIGIVPATKPDAALAATRAVLSQLDLPVFAVLGAETQRLWEYLQSVIADHTWTTDPKPRQERFFASMERQVKEARGRLALDQAALQRLSERLRACIDDEARGLSGNAG